MVTPYATVRLAPMVTLFPTRILRPKLLSTLTPQWFLMTRSPPLRVTKTTPLIEQLSPMLTMPLSMKTAAGLMVVFLPI